MRKNAVSRLRGLPELKDHFDTPTAVQAYLNRMQRETEWGDHLTLQALALFYNLTVEVISSNVRVGTYTVPMGSVAKPAIVLGHLLEWHYVATCNQYDNMQGSILVRR